MDSDAVVSAPHVAQPLRLEPFRAVMLSPSRVADPASARAFARPYRAVAQRLREWEEQGHVVRDQGQPTIYLHEYTTGGLTVRGFVGSMDLSRTATTLEARAVWPHEGIHPRQVDELARRMEEMGINPAPILLVHRGGPQMKAVTDAVLAEAPMRSFTDRGGDRHRLWAVRDHDLRHRLAERVAGAEALLADGHHRYAAYLRLRQAHPGTAWDRGLAMLVDQDDTPLFLGAIHRVLRGADVETAIAVATRAGLEVTRASRESALDSLGTRAAVLTDGTTWAWLATPPGRLAVEVVDSALVGGLPGRIGVEHRHTVDDALTSLSEHSTAVLLPAAGFDDVRRIIRTGGLLPEKATSFQPKPAVGVLMRSLHDE